jgi:hypothetical protein
MVTVQWTGVKSRDRFQTPKWTLYSAHQCNELGLKVKHTFQEEVPAHISSYQTQTLSEAKNPRTYKPRMILEIKVVVLSGKLEDA